VAQTALEAQACVANPMGRKGGKHVRWYIPKKDNYLIKKRRRYRHERRERDALMRKKYGIRGHRACGRKHRYESKDEAMEHACISMAHPGVPQLWVYKCELCGGWHLTSKDYGEGYKVM